MDAHDPELATTLPNDLQRAWLVSVQSLVWTLAASTLAIAIGTTGRVTALVALGAIGLVDAVGSAALVRHFRHAIHHERISAVSERRAHLIVSAGLMAVGLGTVALDLARLVNGSTADASAWGIALSSVSIFVLGTLAVRKGAIAARIQSKSLRTDGHVSAVGAVLAAVALVGSATTEWFHWTNADAVTAMVLGVGAFLLGLTSARSIGTDDPDGL